MSGRKSTSSQQEEREEYDEDTESRFHKQDDLRDILLEEAKLINRVVPKHSLDQIYSFLEANVDDKNRLQTVMMEFLQMEFSVPESKSERESQPRTSLKRGLEKTGCLHEESSYSPKHSKIKRYSSDQETAMVLQSCNISKHMTENEGDVEHSEEYCVPIQSMEFESYDDKIETQYKILREILPNADPTFLMKICTTINDSHCQMTYFVTNAMKKRNYPTLEEYKKRQQFLSLQQKYTEKFNVEELLEIFPDPFKYFLEEKKNQAEISKYVMAYLKSRYRQIRAQDLKRRLQKCKNSLTKTCLELETFKGTLLKTEREEFDWKLDIPLEVLTAILQEVSFIENKEKILRYLQEKEDKRKAAFLKAKSNGELLECGCCFDNELMAEDTATCSEGHLFCKECIKKGAEVKIGYGETKFPCLSDCGAEFNLMTLQSVLEPSVFSKMFQRRQMEEVKAASIEDLESCPHCYFACIPSGEDKVFHCLNPDCMKETCRMCREPSHIPLRCEEIEKEDEVRIRTTIENRMTEALLRTCWKCGKKIIKESGCNVIICTCGAALCYFCRKRYTVPHTCPNTSSDHVLHVTPVREEAKKAKKELKVLNPTLKLKHDPTAKL